jgi:hypothetical protein
MAQTLTPLNVPPYFVDLSGLPLASGLVYFYEAGTSTPQNTYADVNAVAANTNPVVLNSSGMAAIFMLADPAYDIFVCPAATPTPATPTGTLYSILGWNSQGALFAASEGTVQATGATGVTLPYTVLDTDNSITIATASPAGAMQLPLASVRTAANAGNGLALEVYNFSANACTLTTAGSDIFANNGLSTLSLAAGKAGTLRTTGVSTWLVSISTTS